MVVSKYDQLCFSTYCFSLVDNILFFFFFISVLFLHLKKFGVFHLFDDKKNNLSCLFLDFVWSLILIHSKRKHFYHGWKIKKNNNLIGQITHKVNIGSVQHFFLCMQSFFRVSAKIKILYRDLPKMRTTGI